MGLQRFAQRTAERYGADISRLLGVPQRQVNFTFGNMDGVGATSGQNISFNRAWAKGTTRKDLRGAIVHEMAHAYQNIPGGVPGKWVEGMADYARAELTQTPGWNPSQQVRALQRVGEQRARTFSEAASRGEYRRQLLMGNNPNNGPAPGRDVQRRRNTQQNYRSKSGAVAPPLPPGQAFGFAQQMAGLQSTYSQTMAAIKAKGGALRGDFQASLGDIRAQRIQGAADVEGAAQQRGMSGSSVDLANRGANVATATGARIDALGTLQTGFAGLGGEKIQASGDYMTGMFGVDAEKRAAQAELANERFRNDLFDAQQTNYQDIYQRILKKLLAARGRGGATPPVLPVQGGRTAPGQSSAGVDGYGGWQRTGPGQSSGGNIYGGS